MSDTSINSNSIDPTTDGQIGMFGKWRDISAEELAYETKVRKIVGGLGGVFGVLCMIFWIIYAKGGLDSDVGLGLRITTTVTAGIMIPVGIFYNHGHYLHQEEPNIYWYQRGIDPYEYYRANVINNKTLKDVFQTFRPDWYSSTLRTGNLENLVRNNCLTIRQANLLRSFLERYEPLIRKSRELGNKIEINDHYTEKTKAKIQAKNDEIDQVNKGLTDLETEWKEAQQANNFGNAENSLSDKENSLSDKKSENP